jgi:hypothetical protein
VKYPTNAEKEALLLELLSTGKLLDIRVNPAVKGVSLPEYLMKESSVALNIGLNCPIPIYDLVVDSGGICATLSFRREPVFVELPWESLWAVAYDGEKGAWSLGEQPVDKEKAVKARPSYLRLVK